MFKHDRFDRHPPSSDADQTMSHGTPTIQADGPFTARYLAAVKACRVDPSIGFVDLSGVLNHELSPSLLLGVAQEHHAACEAIYGTAAATGAGGETDNKAALRSQKPDVIFTAPASGNALAALYGAACGADVLLCKTGIPKSWIGAVEVVKAEVPSRTMQGVERTLVVKRSALAGKKVVIVDDVLGHGTTAKGLLEMCRDAGAEVLRLVAFVEKVGERGRDVVKTHFPSVPVHPIAMVDVFAPADVSTDSDGASVGTPDKDATA